MTIYTNLTLTSEITAAQQTDQMGIGAQDRFKDGEGLVNYFAGLVSGTRSAASIAIGVGAVKAAATLTVATGGSGNNEACTILNVTFTAKTSGATGNQFNISATAATQATNMANAINGSSNLTGKVVATVLGAVVTITAVQPGLGGNGLQISAGNLANVTAGAFAGGTAGTSYTINLS